MSDGLGPVIWIGKKRPDWLFDYSDVKVWNADRRKAGSGSGPSGYDWEDITDIRLPETHPYYASVQAAAADTINSPSHYSAGGSIECIDAIRAALTPDEFRGYCKGNMLKYVWRERSKGGDESLQKAAKYAEFALEKADG